MDAQQQQQETFLLDEAIKYVGVSRRTFLGLNISSREELRRAKDGKERRMNVYEKAELDRIKRERQAPTHSPAVEVQTRANGSAPVLSFEDLQQIGSMIVVQTVEHLTKNNPAMLGSGTAPDGEAPKRRRSAVDLSAFKDKFLLNLSQAIRLSGLRRDEIKQALADGKILGERSGKRLRINRTSLEQFCYDRFTE